MNFKFKGDISLFNFNNNNNKKNVSIGLDHGNGYVKAMSDEVNELILPSQIAREEDFRGEAYGKEKNIKNYQTVFDEGDNQTYAWGKDVIKARQPIKTYATEERYSKLPYKLLTKFSLSELIGDQSNLTKATVVTGVPSYEKGTQLEKDLENLLLGEHIVSVEGKNRSVEVERVKILAQPLGTVMFYYLDEDGYERDDKFVDEDYYCGVLDIGSGTVDLDGLKELQIQHDDRSTIRKGMFDAYHEIASFIKEKDPRADVNKEKVEIWIRKKLNKGENPYIYNPTRKIEVDFTEAANAAFKKLSEDIMFEVDQIWNRSHFNEIFLTGGGADLLGKYFTEWDRDIIIVEDHQMANAKGFYRFAKSMQLLED